MADANMKAMRWEPKQWDQIAEIAKSVGLTRSEFIRRATTAAMVLPSALCGPRIGAHNAASDHIDHLRKRVPKARVALEGGDSRDVVLGRTATAGRSKKEAKA